MNDSFNDFYDLEPIDDLSNETAVHKAWKRETRFQCSPDLAAIISEPREPRTPEGYARDAAEGAKIMQEIRDNAMRAQMQVKA